MSEWEKWLNLDPSTDDTPLIAKAAIGHYQVRDTAPVQ